MYNVQLAVKTQLIIVLYVQCIHNYMFRPILGRLLVSYSIESEVSYKQTFACRTSHSLCYKKQPEDGLK